MSYPRTHTKSQTQKTQPSTLSGTITRTCSETGRQTPFQFSFHVNDNRPTFTRPVAASAADTDSVSSNNNTSPTLAVIELPASADVGHVVTHVSASDHDAGDNARLSYSIVVCDVIVASDVTGGGDVISGSAAELFAIDEQTGELTVAAPLPHSSQAANTSYKLVIAVSDAGSPSMTSEMTLQIRVSDAIGSRSADMMSRRSALHGSTRLVSVSWWIVVAGCLAAGLLIVLVASCLLTMSASKRRLRKQQRSRALANTATTTTTTTTATPGVVGSSRRKAQPPPPLTLQLPETVDPLTSAMLRRHQFNDFTLPTGLETDFADYVSYRQNSVTESGDLVLCMSAPVYNVLLCLHAL